MAVQLLKVFGSRSFSFIISVVADSRPPLNSTVRAENVHGADSTLRS